MTIDARLSALEWKLGLPSGASTSSKPHVEEGDHRKSQSDDTAASTTTDVSARLAALQATMEKTTTSEFKNTWQECQRLLQELDPGTGLTHQQQPLLYKRQEILAAAPQLEHDFEHLKTLVFLLHKQGGNPLTLDAVTQAPILTSIRVSPQEQRRLDTLRLTVDDLNARTKVMTLRLHQILEAYHAIMSAASEKCILADEVLSMKEAEA